ncbi:type II toxin-antitoxin system HipA family toxin [Rhodospirillaceae bacterium SYSU D60014]|uniref:type II toxin-antitoxin system HipA family toxin n=1 Tax=Virgifigura deserti TaxID=2268457 RepID=UPI000E66C97D
MARRRTRIPLSVYLNGRLVGLLRRETSGAIDFQYDASWLGWDHAMPVSLSLPLREDRFIGEPVIAVFDNLLPDNDEIRRRLAERVRAEGIDAYSLLAVIGRDCVGALQFLPEGAEPEPAGHVSGRPLEDEEIARILIDLKRTPLGLDEDEEFRISLAGAQEKTALLYRNGRWHVPHGTTATTHILKPQIGTLPNGIDLSQSVENEHLCLTLTAALGLPSARSEIQDFEGRRILVVERFDRRWTKDGRLLRLPQEDCCQALSIPPTLKYEPDGGPGIRQIGELLKASDEPDADRRLFLKAQIVFWLLGATDGHAKNFSIHLAPGGRFQLAPLYDVVSAQPSADAGQIQRNRMKLAMAVGDNRHYVVDSIIPRHFLQTAASCGLPAAMVQNLFVELSERAPAAIDETLANLPSGFPETIARSIIDGLRKRLRLFEQATA